MTWLRTRLARAAAAALAGAPPPDGQFLDTYTQAAPDPQNALDLFKGEWASRLPPPFDGLRAGGALLFDDARLKWAIQRLGGVANARVLELGPLEGGHSYILERAGARQVVAIEANSRAYLKCLVIKELLGMPSVSFRHGDFVTYLQQDTAERFDVVIASGVLYHMTNPAELIARMAAISDAVYLWTHYYDEALLSANSALSHRVVAPVASEYGGYKHDLHRHDYLAALSYRGFCGGSRPFANWMTRQGILDALRYFGLTRIDIEYEQPRHEHGPSFSVVARRDKR